MPVWIGDYVLASYGTGAVMSVPCGDQRDWDFANHLLQPMDSRLDQATNDAYRAEAIAFVQAHPKWRLSLQTHKILGLA